MRKFNHMGLWTLFCNSEQGKNDAVDTGTAFDEFAVELHNYCRQEKDLAERTRTLRYAHSELSAAREKFHTGAGKKCIAASSRYSSFSAN